MSSAAGRRQPAAADDQVRFVRLLRTAEVAAVFRVDPVTVRRWALSGRLAYARTPGGGEFRFSADQVAELLADPPEPPPHSGQFRPKAPAAASSPHLTPGSGAASPHTGSLAAAGCKPPREQRRGGGAAGTRRADRDAARIPGRPRLVAVPQPTAADGDDVAAAIARSPSSLTWPDGLITQFGPRDPAIRRGWLRYGETL